MCILTPKRDKSSPSSVRLCYSQSTPDDTYRIRYRPSWKLRLICLRYVGAAMLGDLDSCIIIPLQFFPLDSNFSLPLVWHLEPSFCCFSLSLFRIALCCCPFSPPLFFYFISFCLTRTTCSRVISTAIEVTAAMNFRRLKVTVVGM